MRPSFKEFPIPAFLFVFFVSLYLLTAQGSIQSSDGKTMFLLTQSIAEHQSVSFSEHVAGPLAEKYYSKYGLGMSVLVLPLYFLGKGLGVVLGIDPVFATRFTVSLFNVVVTPLTCVLLYFFALRRLYFSSQVACWLSLGFGLGTIAWPYSEEFMSEPATSLFLLASAYCLTGNRARDRKSLTLWAGVFFGVALSLRSASAIALPGFVVYAFWTATPARGLLQRSRETLRFLIPVIGFGLGLLYYNYVRFGDAFETGYESGMVPHFWTGFLGMLFSPGKSVFLYNPVLILSCVGVPALFRKRPQMAFLIAWVVLSHILLFSFWHSWFGGMSWGPRLLLVVIPLWILPVGYLAEIRPGFFRKAMVVAVIAGALIQVPAVSVNMARYYYQMQTQSVEFEPLLLYDVAHTPLIGQWHQLAEVVSGLGDEEAMQKRTKMALQSTRFAGRDVAEALQWGLAVNAPNFWWYYMKRFGYPLVLCAGPPIVLLCLTLLCGYKLVSHLKSDAHSPTSF
jgi:hypothetical protein